MQHIISKISKGILTILPFLVLFWIFSFVYEFCEKVFYSVFGITNANLFVTLLIFFVSLAFLYYVGHLVDKNKKVLLITITEVIIGRIPLVKSVYSGIKEVLNIFTGKNKEGYLGVAYVEVGKPIKLTAEYPLEERMQPQAGGCAMGVCANNAQSHFGICV